MGSPGEQLTVLGCAEQNVLIPDLQANATPVSAVGAMFATSPLALAALPGACLRVTAARSGTRIGAHSDTVEL